MSVSRSLFALLSVVGLATSEIPSSHPVTKGSPAPPFALAGGAPAEDRTHPTLIAFLDFAEGEPSTPASAPSRAEARVLRSVAGRTELGPIRVVVVDASAPLRGRDIEVRVLAARVQAWQLDRFPVVKDREEAGLSKSYGVLSAPCVFLIDPDGIVRERWDRFVEESEVAGGISGMRSPR